MAKKPAAAALAPTSVPKAPEAPATSVLKYGDFEFEVTQSDEIGEEFFEKPKRGTQTKALPFTAWFDIATHGTNLFIPNEFWVQRCKDVGVEVDPAKVNSTYVRNKIRGLFNAWKYDRVPDPTAENPKGTKLVPKAGREHHDVLFAFRQDGLGKHAGKPGFEIKMWALPKPNK